MRLTVDACIGSVVCFYQCVLSLSLEGGCAYICCIRVNYMCVNTESVGIVHLLNGADAYMPGQARIAAAGCSQCQS